MKSGLVLYKVIKTHCRQLKTELSYGQRPKGGVGKRKRKKGAVLFGGVQNGGVRVHQQGQSTIFLSSPNKKG